MSCPTCRLPAVSVVLCSLLWLSLNDPTQAAAAEKVSTKAAASASQTSPAVNVNVTVNVRVSRDTKVDVHVDAPFAPVIGSLQLPDAVQRFLGGFLKKPDVAAQRSPAKPDLKAPESKRPAKK